IRPRRQAGRVWWGNPGARSTSLAWCPPRCTRRTSTATSATLPRHGGCRAATKFACRGWDGRRAGGSVKGTGCHLLRRWSRRSTRSRNRSTSHRSVRAHECVRDSIAFIGIAVLAVLAALLPPARGRRRLHHAAREGGRRRQSPVFFTVARHAQTAPLTAGAHHPPTPEPLPPPL